MSPLKPAIALKSTPSNMHPDPAGGPAVHTPQAEAVSGAGGALAPAWLGQLRQDHSAETAGRGRHQPHRPHTSTNMHTPLSSH